MPRDELAPGGVYQIVFERDRPVQLVRLTLPGGSRLYPEVSGSHHRCSLRFLRWNSVHSRPVQATEDVRFALTTCY